MNQMEKRVAKTGQKLSAREEMKQFLAQSKADVDAGLTVPARVFLQSLGKKVKGKIA